MNIRKTLLTCFLLTFAVTASAYRTTQPPPNIQDTHVSAHAVYDPSTASYTYTYTITSGPANTGVFDYVDIDITAPVGQDPSAYDNTVPQASSLILSELDKKGLHILPVTLTGPAGWKGGSMSITGEAGWIAPDNVNSVTGLALTGRDPPGIRRISIQPHANFFLSEEGEEEDPAVDAAQDAYFKSITYTTWTLGPEQSAGGVYGQWNQFRDGLNKAVQIGWVADATLANKLVAELAQARTDFQAGRNTAARQDLRTMLATIAASTANQRRPEVADLVNLHATAIINSLPDVPAAPIPFDPVIKVSPTAVTLPVGETYTLTATVINVGNSDAPISGYDLNFTVTDGPDAGMQSSAQTDSNGRAAFSFVGRSLGTDKIAVSPGTPPVARIESRVQIAANTDDIAPFMVAAIASSIGAQAQVTWSGGPDLVVPLFSPPLIESQGGNTAYVQDVTSNVGTTPAGASVTRYYLSTTPPPFDFTQVTVVGERPVPALARGAKSSSGLQPFILPSSIPAGQYFMAACADANNAVVEIDETNNCSYIKLATGNATVVPAKRINLPPDCSQAAASPALLWPPNHKLVMISIRGVTEPENEPVRLQVTKITQDEPVNGLGDGATSPDGFGIGQPQAQVRAERSGLGNGRVYAITFTAEDGQGGTCTGTVRVGVPHDQSQGSTPIDDGQKYNSTVP